MTTTAVTSGLAITASIPIPPWDVLRIGPFSFHLYGLCIALGALAGVSLARKRWADGGRDPDDITTVALVAVPAGLIGARLYHVITDFQLYSDGRWWPDAFMVWKGGLGIPGGVLGGAGAAILVAHYKKMPWREMGDAAAPALPLAQAIGRFGNYFNQELFGRQTDLPWGLQVGLEVRERPVDAPVDAFFHPTFLYESLWNLALVALIVVGTKRVKLKPGRWFPVYIAGYGLGRLWVESLRVDSANTILGLRVNTWTSLLAIVGGLVWLLWGGSPVADGVGEPGPDLDGPRAETSTSNDDAADTVDGIDPQEGPGATEVSEGGGRSRGSGPVR